MNDEWVDPDAAKAQRREAKAAKQRLAQDDATVQSIMSTPGGRAWAHDLLGICAVFQSTFKQDALLTAFAEGQRNIGLRLLADIMRACPDTYVQMMKEQNDGGRTEPDDPEPDGDTAE